MTSFHISAVSLTARLSLLSFLIYSANNSLLGPDEAIIYLLVLFVVVLNQVDIVPEFLFIPKLYNTFFPVLTDKTLFPVLSFSKTASS
ncbi:hypothetical protein SDC9_133087 [bioreactor metagenome]|uniref:Uncharacterized protein n=1 Tax=bioreactor metagenome TaxID=1076179 RepID=A0A645D9J8_9ZZZZ